MPLIPLPMRCKLLIIVIAVSVTAAFGQYVDLDLLNKYPFLKLEDNRLEFKGDSTAFMKFYAKLDTLLFKGKGQVNIAHFGGSHVQAGTLSDRMRQNWLQLSPGLKHSRGFFFPYRLAHTNNPRNYSVVYDGFWEGCRCSVPSAQCRWGVSGINASTIDTNAAFSITAYDGDSAAYSFTRVRVFYILHDSSLVPVPDMPEEVIDIQVDSVQHFVEFTFADPCTTFTCMLQQKDSLQTGFTLQGIQYVDDDPGLIYHSIGVNGAATYSFLRCDDFTNQLQSLKPDLVIFGLGINDAYRPETQFSQATYEANYDTLVWQIREVNPDAVFIFMTNNDSYYKRRYSNPNIIKVQKAMQSLSAKYESAYWDLFEIMGGFNSIGVWERYGLAKRDKIHFTPPGYVLNADLLFDAIKKSYGNYLQQQYQKSN